MDWVYSIGAIGCKACRWYHRVAWDCVPGAVSDGEVRQVRQVSSENRYKPHPVAWNCVPGAVSAAIARSPPSSPDPLLPPAGEGEARLCVWWLRILHDVDSRVAWDCGPGRAVSAAIARSPPSSPDPLFPPAGEGETRLGMEDASGLRPKT